MINGEKDRRNYDGRQQSASQFMGGYASCRRQADSDRSRVRMFTSELSNQSIGTRSYGTHIEEEAESQRLIRIAKQNNLKH